MQQEAARKLGFGAQRTMRLAQQLYEGVDFGEGEVGLITYMRTDSVSLANEALQDIRQVITTLRRRRAARLAARLQDEVEECAGSARSRTSDIGFRDARTAGRQDRPGSIETLRLVCAVASQMEPAVYDTVAVDLVPGAAAKRDGAAAVLRANGSTLVKPGYIAVYKEGQDDASDDDNDRYCRRWTTTI